MNNLLKKPSKMKGFTIVELVIVIAVIAILAAVMIPTFSDIVDKAQDSKAQQTARNAYTQYIADIAGKGSIGQYYVFKADDNRYVAINNGSVVGVYDDANAALDAMVLNADHNELNPISGTNFSVYAIEGLPADPDNDDDQPPEAAKIKVLSQNVRYCNDDKQGNVAQRFERFKVLINTHKPDLIGTQEVTPDWFDKLSAIEGYSILGDSRDGTDDEYDERSAIMYTNRFTLLDSGTFWLTVDGTKERKIAGSGCNRICTWAKLCDTKRGENIIFANTHIDYVLSVQADQVRYLLENLKKEVGDSYDNCTIYLTGDFNFVVNSEPYTVITAAGFNESRVKAKLDITPEVTVTWQNYGITDPNDPPARIDFCFYKGNETVLEYEIINKQYQGEGDTKPGYVSDHYGVITTFQKYKAN